MWGRYLIFVILISSRQLKRFRIKELLVLCIWKLSKSKNHRVSWKRFWKKTRCLVGNYLILFKINKKTMFIYNNQVFYFILTVVLHQNWVFDFFDNRGYQLWYPTWCPSGFGAISDTRPTLVYTCSWNWHKARIYLLPEQLFFFSFPSICMFCFQGSEFWAIFG